MRRPAVVIALLATAMAACAQTEYPLIGSPAMIQHEPIEVYPAQDFARALTAPEVSPDQRLVLHARARLESPGPGGCNWVLRVALNDEVLGETISQPRLLNKPPDFDLLGSDYHFAWFSRNWQAWMVMFADSFDRDMTDAADDFGFLWDVSGLVEGGAPTELRISYAQPELPRVLQRPAPLIVRDLWLGVMPAGEVERMRNEAIAGGKPPREVPVVSEPAPDAPPPQRPYELEWSGRPESPPADITFEDLAGWTASMRGDAEASVIASRELVAWRDQTASVRCSGGTTTSVLELRPPEPIPIAGEWDAIDLWAYVDTGDLHPTRPIIPAVIIEDARGVQRELRLGPLLARHWYVSHAKLEAQRRGHIAFPTRFVALLLEGVNQDKPSRVDLESLAFYREQRRPYAADPRPAQPSFPTGEDAMLPPVPEGARNDVRASGGEFVCTTGDWSLSYTTGDAPLELATTFDRDGGPPKTEIQPLHGAGILFDTPAGPVLTTAENCELIERAVEGETLRTRWRFAVEGVEAEFTVDYRIRGATLVVDVRCAGGAALGTRFGAVAAVGGGDLRTVEVPYLQMGAPPGPLVAYNDEVFVSALYDWPNCEFSRSEVMPDPAAEGGVAINAGSRYEPLTDGRRRDLHDRIIVNIAPAFDQVLPSVPNPRAQDLDEAARYVFVMGSGPTPNQWRSMARYGLRHLIAMHFAGVWWRAAGEGFSMRHRPRPEMTAADMRAYSEQVRALGYPFGVLLEYRDFFPMNEWWDPNLLALTTGGDWVRSWVGHYATKPNAMPTLARRNGELIEADFPLDAVYMDTHTNQSLDARDFEAGVPGAGSGPAQVLANGETILEVKRQHGIVCSEGIYRWLYAGLSDLDYATWPIRTVAPSDRDILPDFDLLRIHPKNIGTGMGYSGSSFFPRESEALTSLFADNGDPVPPQAYDQYLAATVAHGHSGILGYGYFPPMHRMIHYYAMLQGPAREWLTDTAARIERHDGERFVSTSEAIRRGLLGLGRIRITYARGMVVCVNYHRSEPWTVEVAGRSYDLPPMGWVAVKPGEIEAFRALVGGRRVDFARCPEYVYLASPEGPATYGGISVDGAVYVLREGDVVRVLPCGHLGRFVNDAGQQYPFHPDRYVRDVPADRGTRGLAIALAEVAPALAAGATVSGRDFDDQPTAANAQITGGVLRIEPDGQTVDYVIAR